MPASFRLICPIWCLASGGGRPCNRCIHIASVEKRKAEIESTRVWARQIIDCGVAASCQLIKIPHAESERVRRAACRLVGYREWDWTCRRRTVPGSSIRTDWHPCRGCVEKEYSVRTTINKAARIGDIIIGCCKPKRSLIEGENGRASQSVVRLGADSKNHRTGYAGLRTIHSGQLDNHAVVVRSEQAHWILNLLCQTDERRYATGGRALIVSRSWRSPSRTSRSAILLKSSHSQYSIGAQDSKAVVIKATGRTSVWDGGETGIPNHVYRHRTCLFACNFNVRCSHRTPKKRGIDKLDAFADWASANICGWKA